MLPRNLIENLGLGLQDRSPALSFVIQLSAAGQIETVDIKPSWVRVQRRTYAQVEAQLEEEPFKSLIKLADRYRARREAANALFIDLPEVILRVLGRGSDCSAGLSIPKPDVGAGSDAFGR